MLCCWQSDLLIDPFPNSKVTALDRVLGELRGIGAGARKSREGIAFDFVDQERESFLFAWVGGVDSELLGALARINAVRPGIEYLIFPFCNHLVAIKSNRHVLPHFLWR
jgi:hypothetical protein